MQFRFLKASPDKHWLIRSVNYFLCMWVSGLGGVNKQQLRLEWEWIYSWLRSDRRNAVTAATPSRSNVGKFWMEGRCYYKEGMLTVAIKVAVILPVLDALEVMLIITALYTHTASQRRITVLQQHLYSTERINRIT